MNISIFSLELFFFNDVFSKAYGQSFLVLPENPALNSIEIKYT